MKHKLFKTIFYIAMSALLVLRVLQYVLITDADGFFVTESLWQKALALSVYVLLGALTAVSFALRFGGDSKAHADTNALPARAVRWCSLLVALALLTTGVLELLSKQWTGILTLAAALYFTLLFAKGMGKNVKGLAFTAIFALAYPCVRAVELFLDTFKNIQAGETVLRALGYVAMIFFLMTLPKIFMGFKEKVGRIRQTAFLMTFFGLLAGAVGALELVLQDSTDLLAFADAVTVWLTAVLALVTFKTVMRPLPLPTPAPKAAPVEDNPAA